MQPQNNLNNPSGGTGDTGGIVCSECGAPMPQGMRFCRACGHRLGEGSAEYTETVRFPHAPATGPQGTPFPPNYAAPLAQQPGAGFPYKKKRRISGMAWIIILIAALFVLGGVLTAVRRSVSRPPFQWGPSTRVPTSASTDLKMARVASHLTMSNHLEARPIKPAWLVATSSLVSMASRSLMKTT